MLLNRFLKYRWECYVPFPAKAANKVEEKYQLTKEGVPTLTKSLALSFDEFEFRAARTQDWPVWQQSRSRMGCECCLLMCTDVLL